MNRHFLILAATWMTAAAPLIAVAQAAPANAGGDGLSLAATPEALPHDPEATTRAGRYATPRQAYEAKQRLGNEVLLIDVRAPDAHRRTLVGAPVDLRAPLYAADGSDATRAFVATVEQRVAALPRARATPVLLLCDHGRLAAAAAEALATAGFANAIVVTGGLLGEVDGGRPGWIAAGLPVVRTDAAADGPPARRGPGEGPLVRSF
ncbi:MAG: rhodanese-like domain-containing protein [Gammaproteobacteria bacterium]